jgi:hypothetical protein
MIRPFDIRDVSVVQRLTPLARPLACELVAVDGVNPLREAMRAYVSGGRDQAVMLVERDADHDIQAFGLMHILPNTNGDNADGGPQQRRAALVLMAPHAQTDELVEAWMYLAQEFASEAAQRGVHHIVAEAPEVGGEVEALQGAGFAPLIQQDVLKLAVRPDGSDLAEVIGLREQTKDDEPLIKMLHMRAAPKMTYQAEVTFDLLRATNQMDRGCVLVQANELIAHVSLRQGKRGYGMQMLFKTEAEGAARAMLQHTLTRLPGNDGAQRPIYVTVRQYQSWLLPILDDLGFVHMTSTLLMVRHVGARVQQPVWQTAKDAAVIKKPQSASINLESRISRPAAEDATMTMTMTMRG